MNNVRAIAKLSEQELRAGILGGKGSWHDEYRHSAMVFAGGFPFELTEGDLLTIFSQFGEIVDIRLVRDKDTGKSKGFAFLKYEDQRSTDLAVDNLNGATVADRTLRVDHIKSYRRPEIDEKNLPGTDLDMVRRKRDLEDAFGGNAAPEIVGKSVAEMQKLLDAVRGVEGPLSTGEVEDAAESDDGDEVSDTGLDPEDPMYPYMLEAKRELKRDERSQRKADKKHKSKSKKNMDRSSTSTRRRHHGDDPVEDRDRRDRDRLSSSSRRKDDGRYDRHDHGRRSSRRYDDEDDRDRRR
ncbi:hypothetical protein BC828DRAFT_389802 [Blastocladiella britannica]|nr:hypothetical protein BC828DRAFT_389802 [Blastocladiella britannica]